MFVTVNLLFLYVLDTQNQSGVFSGLLPWVKLIDNFDAEYEYVTNEGTLFTFKTNLDAPRYRLININFDSPKQTNWKELVPQHDKDVIGELVEYSCDLDYQNSSIIMLLPDPYLNSSAPFSCRPCSVCHMYILQLSVRVFPPRCQEHVEDVPPELRGGAEDLSS